MDEEDAGRKVGDQCMEHVSSPAQVVGNEALLRDVDNDSFPTQELPLRREKGYQRVANPAGRAGTGKVRHMVVKLRRRAWFNGLVRSFLGVLESVLKSHGLHISAELGQGCQH